MADPTTIAMAAKAAVAVATDKKTWKAIAVAIGISVGVTLLPLLLIMSIFSGGAQHNKDYARIVFDGSPVPADATPEYRDYILKMQDAFAKLKIEVDSINAEMSPENHSSLEAIRVKAVFFTIFAYGENGAKNTPPVSSGNNTLYFGTDFTSLDELFYKDFAACFADVSASPATAIADLNVVYSKLSTLVGREITETDKQNSSGLYQLIKYGYAASPNFSGIPSEAFNDETFAKLMSVATKYIGYPYVWGGSTPSTSFDCSGFICYSYTKSGVRNIPRTTAQGIYDQCAPVSKDELKPGDLVFFTKTYKTTSAVTHIGIFVGDGRFLHCGDPIGYLLRMAGICLATIVELKSANQEQADKSATYKITALGLQFNYKPYTDKGKLKNKVSDLEQAFEVLQNALLNNKDTETVLTALNNFADYCIRSKVYLDTRYELDLAQQESLLNRTLPSTPEQETSKAFEMIMT